MARHAEDLLASGGRRFRNSSVIIDPNRAPQWAAPLNLLARVSDASTAVIAEKCFDAVCRAVPPPTDHQRQLAQELLPPCYFALAELGLTLAEAEAFASMADPSFRRLAIPAAGPDAVRAARSWVELGSFARTEAANRAGPARKVSSLLMRNRVLAAMLGQVGALDWHGLFSRRAAVVVSAAPGSTVSATLKTLLGTVCLSQFFEAVRSRKSTNALWFIVDDAPEFYTEELAKAFEQVRSFGAFGVVAPQSLAHFEQVPGLRECVSTNAAIKIAFRSGAAEAEDLAAELFAGHEDLQGLAVKHRHVIQVERHREEEREIVSRTTGRLKTTGSGSGGGSSHSLGFSGSGGYSDPQPSPPDATMEPVGYYTGSSGSHRSDSSSESFSFFESETVSESQSVARVPFLKPVLEDQEQAPQFHSADEARERFKAAIQGLPKRHALVRIGDVVARRVRIADSHSVPILDRTFKRFMDAAAPNFARPVDEVLAEIDARVPAFIEERRALLDAQERERDASEPDARDAASVLERMLETVQRRRPL